MALLVSDPRSPTLEPNRKNRFIFQFEAIPGSDNLKEDLAFACKTAGVPNFTFNETPTHRLNETFWGAGKVQYNELPCTFYDYIQGEKSAANILYNWSTQIYDPKTGAMKYKKHYATNGMLAHLDPMLNVTRLWNIFFVWPKMVSFGDTVSQEDDTLNEIGATFRYDYAIKSNDIDPLG